jgi:YfiH family protein
MLVASGNFPQLRRAAWFITGRHGGCSSAPFDSANLATHVGDQAAAVLRNRDAITQEVGADRTVWLNAEHGARSHGVPGENEDQPADIVFTRTNGIALAALSADCVPLALAGAGGAIAVAHVGWRGLVAGAVSEAIRVMADTAPIDVVVGPAICGACYAVPLERIEEVATKCAPPVAKAAIVDATHLDVRAGVIAELALHSPVVSVQQVLGCTACDPQLFSYRRDGITGRHAMITVMNHE